MSINLPFDLPPAPTDKKRIVFSFGVSDLEFFKCFPSDDFLGTRYDMNPAQLVIVWDIFLRPYNCELQIYSPRNQLLVSMPVPKSVNVPYTIVDGMINEWVTKEEFVNFQFVFTKDGQFVKSTLPVRMNLSPANKPDFMKIIKPVEFDRMKLLYDKAVTSAVLRFADADGWVYDFFAEDGTLRFSLGWIPHDVVRCTEQVLSANEKMIARENIRVPFTFVLPLEETEGTTILRNTTSYINTLVDATFEVWRDNGDGSFTEVIPLSKSYNGTSISMTLSTAVKGKIRVSCKSVRFIPNDDSVLIESVYSGNGLMNENDCALFTSEEQRE